MLVKTVLSLLIIVSCLLHSTFVQANLPQTVKIALSNDSYPIMFVNQQGEIDGLAVDYWREVAKRSGFNIEFVVADWPDTLQLLQQGQVDLHGAMAITPERTSRFNLTKLYIEAYSNVYVRRDLTGITSLTDLQPFVIGAVHNTGHLEALKQPLPEGNFLYFANMTELFEAALDGRLAAFTAMDKLTEYHPRYDELSKKFPLYNRITLRPMELAFAVLPEQQPFATELQQAVNQLDQAFLIELERRWLGVSAAQDTLLVGVSINNQPYMHVSLQGEAEGLFVDLWRLWSEQTGQKITFIPDNSFNNISNLAKGRIDAVMAFPNNNRVPDNVMPAQQLYAFQSHFYHPKQLLLNDLNNVPGQTIGLYENAPYLTELKQLYPHLTFKLYRGLPQLVNATLSGEIAGFFGGAAIMPIQLRQLNVWDSFSRLDGVSVSTPLFNMVRQDRPGLAEEIRSGFAALSLAALEQYEAKWVDEPEHHYFAMFRQQIPLTTTETEWLKQHPRLRLGMLSNWPPMEFTDNDGKPAGVTVDMFNLLSERLKLNIDIQVYNSFDQMLSDLQQQKIDLIANVSELADRRSYAVFTDEFWSTQWAALSPGNSQAISSVSDLSNKKVAVYQDYQLAKHLADSYPSITVVPVPSLRQGLNLLQNAQVDFVLESVEAATEMLKQPGYIYMRIQILDDLPSYPSLIAVRKDFGPLADILNKGLHSISKEQRQQLFQKSFNFQITQGINKEQLNRLMWQVGGAALLLLLFFVVWNLSLRREIRLRRQAEQKMRFMATHDELTGLPNRSLIRERIEQALLQHARHNELLAILFIDLDGFKQVNDEYGHDAGDELLLKLAAVLQEKVRKSDTVARFGGDEFVILLTGLLSPEDAAIVAQKILHQLAQPLALSVGEVQVGASIGIAVYPDDGTDSARLLKVADSLMYRIKQQGKNQYCFSKAVFS